MPQLVFESRFSAGQTSLDVGITDLMVVEGVTGPMLYATSGQLGGLTAYDLGQPGSASLADFAYFDAAWSDGVMRDLALLDNNGTVSLAVAASGTQQVRLFELAGNGDIGQSSLMSGVNAGNDRSIDLSQWGADMLFMAPEASGEIQGYAIAANGTLTQQITVKDTAQTYVSDAIGINTFEVNGVEFMASVSQADSGVSVFYIDPTNKLFNTANMGVNEGLGIMTPTDSALVNIGDKVFIIVASAPSDGQGQSGALTVLEIGEDGSIRDVEHLNDTADTRFGQVQTLDVVEHNGQVYVLAGGGDDGLTLFAMLPSGRLQLLDVMTSAETTGFDNVAATATMMDGDTMRVFAATEAQGGYAEVTLDLSVQGVTQMAGHHGTTLSGGGLDDILIGGAGADVLQGFAGDDLIEDGHGSDTLIGGDGADTYILRADGLADRIEDFQPGQDRLDLSDWPMFYDPEQIGYTATATGAILTWRSETVEIVTRNAQMLSAAEVQAAILSTASRAPDFDAIFGNSGAQDVQGTSLDDVFVTGAGNDTITAGLGDDFVDGGTDADSIAGGFGNDTLLGGDGADQMDGGINNDTLNGGSGNDTLYGMAGVDTLVGGDGDDLIFGGDDPDILLGLGGADTLNGGEGDDLYYAGAGHLLTDTGTQGFDVAIILDGSGDAISLTGWSGIERVEGNVGHDVIDASALSEAIFIWANAGNDTVQGGAGNDTLLGGDGADSISGGSGQDTILGWTGNDSVDAGAGDDLIYVFDDGDVVHGGAGYDEVVVRNASGLDLNIGGWSGVEWVMGFTGNDTLNASGYGEDIVLVGGNGADVMSAGLGNDTIYADAGDDYLFGSAGDDALIGSGGNDTLEGGLGKDYLAGGTGADVFVFDDGFGEDVVAGYEDGSDRLDVSGLIGVSGFGDLTIWSAGGHTFVHADGDPQNFVTLADYTAGLGASDFIF
ncbi:calcium-binding protein [Gymnodinialimonas hymeniacidonis]|uniref:calcium-binding protein n=1 Tax=Gymnodinialimonas hymeniacidonis TaxID=3126508 RepID=UPI0034C5E388